jgi:hypothetical protein
VTASSATPCEAKASHPIARNIPDNLRVMGEKLLRRSFPLGARD